MDISERLQRYIEAYGDVPLQPDDSHIGPIAHDALTEIKRLRPQAIRLEFVVTLSPELMRLVREAKVL